MARIDCTFAYCLLQIWIIHDSVHDLAEAIVGDITPHDNVSNEDKHAMERKAMEDMAQTMLGSTPESLEILALWEEYEAAETPEALAVKDIDKFEV
jgi:putative hydrolase of HD superfamily